jgi:predicted alpha/beta hydrolase family esterase
MERAALCGHSTGCQNSVHFMKHAPAKARLRVVAAALQAPVKSVIELRSSVVLAAFDLT